MKLPDAVALTVAQSIRWLSERKTKLDFNEVPFQQLADAVGVSKKAGLDADSASKLDALIAQKNHGGLARLMTELHAAGRLPGNWEVSVSSTENITVLGGIPATMLKQTPVYTEQNVASMNEAATSTLQHIAKLRAQLADGVSAKLPQTLDAAADQLTDVVRGLHQDYARVSTETVRAWIANGITEKKGASDAQLEALFASRQSKKERELDERPSPASIVRLAKMFTEGARISKVRPSQVIGTMEALRGIADEVSSLSMAGPQTFAKLKRTPQLAASMTELLSLAIQQAAADDPAALKAFFDREPAFAREQLAKAFGLDFNALPAPRSPWNAIVRELEAKGYNIGSVPGEEVIEIRGRDRDRVIGYLQDTGFPGSSRMDLSEPTIHIGLSNAKGNEAEEIAAIARRITNDTGVKLAFKDRS